LIFVSIWVTSSKKPVKRPLTELATPESCHCTLSQMSENTVLMPFRLR